MNELECGDTRMVDWSVLVLKDQDTLQSRTGCITCYCILRSKLSCKTLYNQKVTRSNNIIDLFKTNLASCGNG